MVLAVVPVISIPVKLKCTVPVTSVDNQGGLIVRFVSKARFSSNFSSVNHYLFPAFQSVTISSSFVLIYTFRTYSDYHVIENIHTNI